MKKVNLILINIVLLFSISCNLLSIITWENVPEISTQINRIKTADDEMFFAGEDHCYLMDSNGMITDINLPDRSFVDALRLEDNRYIVVYEDFMMGESYIALLNTVDSSLTNLTAISNPGKLSHLPGKGLYTCATNSGMMLSYDGLAWGMSELMTSPTHQILECNQGIICRESGDLYELHDSMSFAYNGQSPITAPELNEISGLVASRQHPGIFWAITDSGGDAVVYALNSLGELVNTFPIPLSDNRDYEDIAIGQLEEGGPEYIFIADVGNNSLATDIMQIYVVPEPVDVYGTPIDLPLENVFHFQYPDRNYDCETLMFDPISKNFYILIKSDPNNSIPDNKMFVLEAPHENTLRTVELVGNPDFPTDFVVNRGATAGDISYDGGEILVRTYDHVYYWQRGDDQSVEDAMNAQAEVLPYNIEAQGESICWNLFSEAYYTASETVTNISRYTRSAYSQLQVNIWPLRNIFVNDANNILLARNTPEYGVYEVVSNLIDVVNLIIPGYRVNGIIQLPNTDYVLFDIDDRVVYYDGIANEIADISVVDTVHDVVYDEGTDYLYVAGLNGVVKALRNTPIEENVQQVTQTSISPNPFIDSVTFKVDSIMKQKDSKITIYNVKGQRIYSQTQSLQKGLNELQWNGLDRNNRSVPTGVYFYKIDTGESSLSGKLVKMK